MDWRTLFPGKEKGKSAEKIQVQDQSNMNILTNRLSALNGKIPLDWLNGSLDSLKIKVKGYGWQRCSNVSTAIFLK